jgi:hypothetical protein
VAGITFLIPTCDPARPLSRALNALVYQLQRDDSILIIGDTFDHELPQVEKLVGNYGPQVKYLPFNAGRHTFGHDQLNYGISQAQGDYIQVSDDDDVHTPTAAAAMRRMIADAPGVPNLMRFVSYFGLIFWDERGVVRRDHIGGHCLLMPNIPGKTGTFGPEYSGDFDWVDSTLMLHGGHDSAVWHEDIVAVARPS